MRRANRRNVLVYTGHETKTFRFHRCRFIDPLSRETLEKLPLRALATREKKVENFLERERDGMRGCIGGYVASTRLILHFSGQRSNSIVVFDGEIPVINHRTIVC